MFCPGQPKITNTTKPWLGAQQDVGRTEVMVENMLDGEAQEGIGAFLDKREPNWPR